MIMSNSVLETCLGKRSTSTKFISWFHPISWVQHPLSECFLWFFKTPVKEKCPSSTNSILLRMKGMTWQISTYIIQATNLQLFGSFEHPSPTWDVPQLHLHQPRPTLHRADPPEVISLNNNKLFTLLHQDLQTYCTNLYDMSCLKETSVQKCFRDLVWIRDVVDDIAFWTTIIP